MKANEIKEVMATLRSDAEKACEIARVAVRNSKSLQGDNSYAARFHAAAVEITKAQTKVQPVLTGLDLAPADTSRFNASIAVIVSTEKKTGRERADAVRDLVAVSETVILPKLDSIQASPIPATERVLPACVVEQTGRKNLIEIVKQANGTYEHGWFDACSVMVRRLVETLIIEVYEANTKAADIKDSDGNYLMLSKLIDKMLADASWNLGRETKKGLPLIKSLGDRSAHNRFYLAKKPDVDNVTHELRVVVEEFIMKAGLNMK